MAKFVFGMNLSLDGYVDHEAFAPGPALFRHWIEHVRGLTASAYGRRLLVWSQTGIGAGMSRLIPPPVRAGSGSSGWRMPLSRQAGTCEHPVRAEEGIIPRASARKRPKRKQFDAEMEDQPAAAGVPRAFSMAG